ncbi:CLUMA_CG012874, isoform A [Clunio marinus]|uniref:CLUMA_CG012874, isoform A n=1 Tax=Clunio marinus TaxID=568069 RepID=A0A1J1IJ36_9DIPT|nr:CLUMA_CG012874, isoform A [Clunio marinus]
MTCTQINLRFLWESKHHYEMLMRDIKKDCGIHRPKPQSRVKNPVYEYRNSGARMCVFRFCFRSVDSFFRSLLTFELTEY